MSREKRKKLIADDIFLDGVNDFSLPVFERNRNTSVMSMPVRQFPTMTLAAETVRHPRLLAHHLSKLYATGAASDCTLVSRDGKEFPAHRAILTAWSPVFAAMFTTNMTEKACGVCKMDNFDGRVIEAMLKFIYTCSLSGIGEFVEDLLDMADQYDMPDLNKACQELMERDVTVKTAPWYFYLADRRGLGVKGKVADFIAQHKHEF